jgi:hypothetical protein
MEAVRFAFIVFPLAIPFRDSGGIFEEPSAKK